MSVLDQFISLSEQPGPPPPAPPRPAAISLWKQPVEHVVEAAHMEPLWHGQWDVLTEHVLIDFAHWPSQGPRVLYPSRIATPLPNEQPPVLEESNPLRYVAQLSYPAWESSGQQPGQEPALGALEQAYVIEERPAVSEFIMRNQLLEPLLLAAREPLASAFGEGTVKKLSLVEDDEGFVTLFCFVMVPGEMIEARRALNSFDESWWLARAGQFSGKLNFDFELV